MRDRAANEALLKIKENEISLELVFKRLFKENIELKQALSTALIKFKF